jgi:hypothetical protein
LNGGEIFSIMLEYPDCYKTVYSKSSIHEFEKESISIFKTKNEEESKEEVKERAPRFSTKIKKHESQ